MLTVRELQEAKVKLQGKIAALLNEFTAETGYAIESLDVQQSRNARYYYGTYIALNHLVSASVDISTEYKLRAGQLVKSDTWIDEIEEGRTVNPEGNQHDKDISCYELIRKALKEMRESKPDERSEKARRYAVSITEMEKVLAYFHDYVVNDGAGL